MIDDKLKVISIDIPRTGTSARARLFANMPEAQFSAQAVQEKYWTKIHKHATAFEHFINSPAKYFSYFKFTFVRNPWDRMVSFYKFRQRKYEINADFNTYIQENLFQDLNRQQLDYICFYRKKVMIDFIGRFERLYEDFELVCQRMHFAERLEYKPEKLSGNYVSYYDDATRKIVALRFKEDIEFFGYKFGN